MTNHQIYKTRLLERKEFLLGRREKAEDTVAKSGDAPFDGEAARTGRLDVVADLDELAASEIRAIDAALDRIADGSFGDCVTCGDEISEARLETLPHTPFCADHAG